MITFIIILIMVITMSMTPCTEPIEHCDKIPCKDGYQYVYYIIDENGNEIITREEFECTTDSLADLGY